VDFATWKKKNAATKADYRNPWMGFDGKVCENPVYWCRLHEVWLSESDVKQKKCLSKLTPDMMGIHKCNCIERRIANPFIKG
jgi:hypothetical protein